MEKSDEELILSYKEGNAEAFAELIERYGKPIFLFVYKMTLDSDISNDVAQETFVKIWKTFDRYKEGANFKSWIFTIARNTAIDYLRKKRSVPFSEFDADDGKNYLEETIKDEYPIPIEIIERMERNREIKGLLEKLSPADREIMDLHYREELTFDEIGKILNKPLDTVKSRHRRALIKLRQVIKENDEKRTNL